MKKKVLFIDRDGTLIHEPPVTQQVDTLQQLSFLPGVIRNLYRLCTETDYELVMVTNQDGLGTAAYPQENFDTVQGKMLEILSGEGIQFNNILIDTSYEHENKPTRKPRTGLLTPYLDGGYDIAGSYVIGDRLTDVQLAANIGAKAILLVNDSNASLPVDSTVFKAATWDSIYTYLKANHRTTTYTRTTNETNVTIQLNIDGTGMYDIHTGIGFFDHMLEQLVKHSRINLTLKAIGDTHIDEHHTIEDVALALGQAFTDALGSKRGIERYGFCLPMDDCLAQVAIDFGGRSYTEWHTAFKREYIGQVPTEMFQHFFKSFSDGARCNIYIKAEGTNEHHKIEAIFKAFAKSIKMAVAADARYTDLPSTKGLL